MHDAPTPRRQQARSALRPGKLRRVRVPPAWRREVGRGPRGAAWGADPEQRAATLFHTGSERQDGASYIRTFAPDDTVFVESRQSRLQAPPRVETRTRKP